MDSPYSPVEFRLLNDWQRDFPLVPRPFHAIGEKIGAGETAILGTLGRLSTRGAISRVGAVFAPRRVGAGTLAALAAPPERIEEIAARISARPEVNHNYQREHRLNLWFVVTASDRAALAAALDAIAADTGCPVISMPLHREYHIDLGFDLGGGQSGHKGRTCRSGSSAPARTLDVSETRLLAALEPGLPLVSHPFAALGKQVDMAEATVLEHIARWTGEGLIKRFGIVVRHHELGYRANAMVVFDLPDDRVDTIGEAIAGEPGVTLCYRRERCLPQWPGNLYCMVHGRSREEVAPIVARLSGRADAEPTVLFSVRRFKQCGARYFAAP